MTMNEFIKIVEKNKSSMYGMFCNSINCNDCPIKIDCKNNYFENYGKVDEFINKEIEKYKNIKFNIEQW